MATAPSPNFVWRRSTKEYLTSLTERKKWNEKRQNLKVRDVVLLSESNQQRGIWPLGRVVSTHPGEMEESVQLLSEFEVEYSKDQ